METYPRGHHRRQRYSLWAASFSSPIITDAILAGWPALSKLFNEFLLSILLGFALVGVILSTPPRNVKWVIRVTMILTIPLIIIAILSVDPRFNKPWHSITDPNRLGIAASIAYVLFAAAASTIVAVLWLLLALFVVVLVEDHYWRRYPNLTLLNSLIQVMGGLNGRRAKIYDLTFKKRISSYLERAAQIIGIDLPNAMSLPDRHARAVLQERCEQAAAELRRMQISLVLSEKDTLNQLKETVATFVGAIATGNYYNLPCSSAVPYSEPRKKRLVRAGKTVVIAAIPITCLISARYADLRFSAEFNNWAIGVSLLWAAITLISVLDPLYKTRIQEIQNIFSFIRKSDS